jgi:hypothetical protein
MIASQCLSCAHFRGRTWTCDAFPGGIPDDVAGNLVDHREAVDGDGGVRWAPARPTDKHPGVADSSVVA